MNHPIIINTTDVINNLGIAGERLQRLLYKPKPILWKRGEKYYWIPIEKVRASILWYHRGQKDIYPPQGCLTFAIDDCVVIPQIAGEVIFKYNGHDED